MNRLIKEVPELAQKMLKLSFELECLKEINSAYKNIQSAIVPSNIQKLERTMNLIAEKLE